MSQPYPSYKDSGIDSVGLVPRHWSAAPVKYVASCNDEVLPEGTDPDLEIDYVEISGVSSNVGIVASTRVSFSDAPSRARRKVRDGDILVSTVRTYLRAITQVTDPPDDMIASTGFAVLRPRRASSGFLGYLFTAEFMIGEIISRSVGVSYPAINASDIMGLKIPLPPLEQQRAIAAFLDRETGKIDALVEEQRRLIALLKEKRQAVISHAVTKGLDRTAPRKPSGIDWLGDIPAHWTPCLLKRAFRSVDYGISDALDGDGAVAVLRMGNIEGGGVRFDDLKYVSKVPADLLLEDGDLLFNRTNSLDLIGKVGKFADQAGTPISFASYLVRLRLAGGHSPDFFAFLLNTPGLLGEARARAFVAIGQCNLNPTRYGQIRIAVPPLHEQEQIAAHLQQQASAFDALISEAETAIGLLLERRSALISAAVTGKIDVRAHAPDATEAA